MSVCVPFFEREMAEEGATKPDNQGTTTTTTPPQQQVSADPRDREPPGAPRKPKRHVRRDLDADDDTRGSPRRLIFDED